MDSFLSYEPIRVTNGAYKIKFRTDDLRDLVIKFIKRQQITNPNPNALTIEGLISFSFETIDSLLTNPHDENRILRHARESAAALSTTALLAIRGAIVQWYLAVSKPVFGRQQHEPMLQTEYDGDASIETLAYFSMLDLSEIWQSPDEKDEEGLQITTLLAKSAVSFLIVGILMIPHLADSVCSLEDLTKLGPRLPFEAFLRAFWEVTKSRLPGYLPAPAAEFGANLDEVKLTVSGHSLMVKTKKNGWHKAPLYHPARVVLGSAWNKWMKNEDRKVFMSGNQNAAFPELEIWYRVPSSALTLIESFRSHYEVLRRQFREREMERHIPDELEKTTQFWHLAEGTGLSYPVMRPWEEESDTVEDVYHGGYFDYLPFTTKPTCDMYGNFSLPFLNGAADAFRMGRDPHRVEDFLFSMCFGG